MKRRTTGMGRIFKRKSRLTGRELTTWWFAYHHRGNEHRESAHTTVYEEAVRKLRKRLDDLSNGTYVGPDRQRVTVSDLLDYVVTDYENDEQTSLPTLLGHVKVWKQEVGDERAMDITTARVQRIIQAWKKDGKSPATINRRLACLRRAYRLGKVPTEHLDFAELQLAEHSPRGRYVTAEAFAAIVRHVPEYLRDFLEFAYLTGVRKSQLASTTWANLNTETWVLTWSDPRRVKNRHVHDLALDGRPLEIIQKRWAERRLDCRLIFHRDGAYLGDFRRAWATACRLAGFPVGRKHGGFVFHNTRHTAVTNLVNAGVPAHEAMGVSGHRTRSVFDRYSIKLHEQTRAALRRTTAYVQSLSTQPKVIPLAPHEAADRDPVHTSGTHLDRLAR
jgi:integrase